MRLGLGRLFVAVSAISLLSVAGGWAFGAPDPSPANGAEYVPAVMRVPAEPVLKPDRAASLLERQATAPTNTKEPRRHLIAAIERDMRITARPGGRKVIGRMPAGSRYYGVQHRAWILDRAKNGRFGKVAAPYSGNRGTGWIRLAGLDLSHTAYSVRADLSSHRIKVMRFEKTIMRIPSATGAPGSPTPPGRYFVTDRVPIPGGGSFGTFAFGISGIQTNLPAGWSGGDQLAIHGTNDPGSIGTSASAGCLRVSSKALERLKPLLGFGTPVTIKR
jgi:hypothetical protein